MTLAYTDLLEIVIIGGLMSFLVTPAAMWLARRWDILDRPRGYKAHRVATPLLGGFGIAAGTLCGAAWLLPRNDTGHLAGLSALAVGGVVILVAGLVDDVRGLSPQYKFLWQLAAATAAGLCLALLGVRLDLFLHWPSPPIIMLTALWVVGITNAVNFLDNMNGLCAGLGAVAALSLALTNARSGEFTVAVVAAALAGSCLGFIPYNWPQGLYIRRPTWQIPSRFCSRMPEVL